MVNKHSRNSLLCLALCVSTVLYRLCSVFTNCAVGVIFSTKPRHYAVVKINVRTWYWVWSESSVYDFLVSTLINRTYIFMLHILTLTTLTSVFEFVFFFKAIFAFNVVSNLSKVFGTKIIIVTFIVLLNSLFIACWLI